MSHPTAFGELQYLDSGAYASVLQGTDGETGDKVALKLVHSESERAVLLTNTALRELQALTHLCHPNIVRLLRFVFVPGLACFVFPLYDCNLGEYMRVRRELPPASVRHVVRELARGLQAAHERGFVHRDLKPGNILVSTDLASVVLADWGMTRALLDASPSNLSDEVITTWYAPPEVLCRHTNYTFSVDVWSLGILALDLVWGAALFGNTDCGREDFMGAVLAMLGTDFQSGSSLEWLQRCAGPRPDSLPGLAGAVRNMLAKVDRESALGPAFLDMVHGMLAFQPDSRPTARKLLTHPWLREDGPETPAEPIVLRGKLRWTVCSPDEAKLGEDEERRARCLRLPAATTAPPADFVFGWKEGHDLALRRLVLQNALRRPGSPNSFLLAMHMSHLLRKTTPRMLMACVTLADSVTGPIEVMASWRETTIGRQCSERLRNFGFKDMEDYARVELEVLSALGGRVPLLPACFHALRWLPLDGPAQRMALFLLTEPKFLVRHGMDVDAVRRVALLYQYGGTSGVLESAIFLASEMDVGLK